MTVVTVRPNATVSNVGATIGGGAASLQAATSDDSDSTYIQLTNGDSLIIGFAEPVLPVGAAMKSLALRARCAAVTQGSICVVSAYDGSTLWAQQSPMQVTWTSPTTVTVGMAARSVAPSDLKVQFGSVGTTFGLNFHELYVDATYVTKPTVTVDAPANGSTVTDTNLPTISWTPTLDADGGGQTSVKVRVFSQAQYTAGGFDPATSASVASWNGTSESSWTDTTILADGTYRAYVLVGQTVSGAAHLSDWAYTQFTVNVAVPAVPVLTVTPDDATASIALAIDGQAGAATTDALEVQRSTDDGSTWQPLRLTTATDGVIIATDATLTDFEAANGQTVQYRARAMHDYSGVYASSGWTTGSGAWTSTSWWLKSPEQPALNTPVEIRSIGADQRTARQGVLQPLGATRPIIVSDTRSSRTGTFVLKLATTALQDAVDALLDSNTTLLLQSPASDRWGSRYLRPGDHTRTRPVDMQDIQVTFDSIAWTEVAAPPGVITGWPPAALPDTSVLPSTTLYPSD